MKLPRGFSLCLLSALAASTAAAQTAIDLRTQAKSVDFSAASMTKPMKTGTALPATCTTGDMYFKSDAPAGGNLYGCVSANTWSQQAGGAGGGSGAGTPNVSQSFTTATAVTVNHALATTNVIVQCYDGASKAIEANTVTVIDSSSVAVTFSSPQSGRCVVNGTGGSGGGGGGGGSGESNTASNVGTAGIGPFHQKFGIDLQFKNLNSGSNRVSVTNDTVNREIDIDVVPANFDLAGIGGSLSAAQITAASKQGNGAKLQTFGTGTPAANDCAKFDASGNLTSAGAPCGSAGGGEANTASNAGVGGVGVFHQKSGVDLQFKSINAASSRVSVSNDATNREVDIDVVSSNLDLSLFGGSLAPSQIAATGRQGNGAKVQMSGTGTPAANDCAKFDANGNIVSAGAACGAGGGGDTIESDFGIVITQTGASVKKVGVDTATVPTFLSATTSLDFTTIAQSACSELSLNVPGAATGDAVAAGWPHTLDTGLSGTMFVSSQNTVTVRLCKITTGSVDPANQAFRATIVRSF